MDKNALQRHDRIAEYRAILSKMDAEQLKRVVGEAKVALEGDETREEIEFAVAEATVAMEEAEAARDAAAKIAAEEKAKREQFYQTKEGKKQRAIDEAAARDNAVRRVNHGFISALPPSARMQGAHQPDPASASPDHPVPDGRYRVSGSHWVMTFAGGKWSSADMAHARGEPDWIEVPDVAGGSVGARPSPGANFEAVDAVSRRLCSRPLRGCFLPQTAAPFAGRSLSGSFCKSVWPHPPEIRARRVYPVRVFKRGPPDLSESRSADRRR